MPNRRLAFVDTTWRARRGRLAVALGLVVATIGVPVHLQGRRVVDVVTMGDARSERDHDYAAERVTEGLCDGRTFKQAGGWIQVSLTVYEDTDVTLVGTFRGNAGVPLAFELLVDGRAVKIPEFVSGSSLPARVEYLVPAALTRGKTRISVTLRAVSGPTPGLIELRTVQEHLERS